VTEGARETAPLFFGVKPGRRTADRNHVELKVSRPVKIVALVGILAAVGAFLGLNMLGGSPAPVSHVNPHPHGAKVAAGKKKSSLGTLGHTLQRSGKRKSAPLAPPKVKAPVKKHKAKASPAPVTIATDGLPFAISRALAMHAVVVAVLYDPQARTDAISTAEAKAGAALAHAGFVPVNVLRRSEIQAIAEQLRVIHAPTVLVFRRPSSGQPALYVQLTGFADKETVAQAAQNAYPAAG